jgi:ribonuclease I
MRKDLINYFTYYLALFKCNKNSEYTIHGLWIDYSRGGYPEFCNSDKFDIELLDPLRKNLDKYWGGCFGNSIDLWEHEWKKHGTCFYPRIEFTEYFNKTLNLFLTVDKSKCKDKDCMILINYDQILLI